MPCRLPTKFKALFIKTEQWKLYMFPSYIPHMFVYVLMMMLSSLWDRSLTYV